MRVIFCRSNTIGGFLLRLFTMSKWNHVALEYNGRVIDANTGVGVTECGIVEFNGRYSKTETVKITSVNDNLSWKFAMNQVGKPYDWKAIFAFPFRKNWESENKYFCSELVASALIHGGKSIRIKSNRVTPRDLWALL